MKLLDKFKGMARVEIENGSSCSLWEDLWGNEIPCQKYPELFSFAKNKQIVFAEGHAQIPLHNLFHPPLSQQAHVQLLMLQEMLDEIVISDASDKWVYIWNSNKFSVKKAYRYLSGHLIIHPAFKWL